MTYQQSRIGRIRVAEQSAWGTAATSFTHAVEAEVGAYPALATEAIMTDALTAHHYHSAVISGSKVGGTLSLTIPIHGWSSSSDPSTCAAGDRTADQIFVEHALGSMFYGNRTAETTSLTGGSTTSATFAAGNVPTDVRSGEAILVPISGGYSVGWVQTQDVDGGGGSDSLTLSNELADTPSSSGHCYGGMTAAMTNGTTTTPLTIQYQMANSNSVVRLVDCVVTSLSIDINPKEQPKMTIELQAGDWVNDGTGGAPGNYDYASTGQLPVAIGANGSRLLLGGTASNVASFNIAFTNEIVEAKSHASSQGLAQFVCVNRSCAVSYTMPAETITAQQPGHTQRIQLDVGANTVGNCLSVYIPSGVLTSQAALGDSDGLIAETFEYAAGLFMSDSTNTAPGNTSARIAFL